MISCYRLESRFNLLVSIEPSLVHKVVQALAVEHPFDFRENCFYRLEFRRVPDVPYWLEVQLRPLLFDARLLMDRRIVRE